ncbi:hypothetical protein ACETK8_20295 (plasmid) [Brevundimonas staleyi]|uniref:Uncharacterized protein n=1 Tax=Brevundimonas staleyi TaxID=74326 RepID=A0ABW0FRN9_9CAUL
MAANDYDLALEELTRASTMRLLASESFDLPSFAALYDHLGQKAEALKSEHVISKQILDALRNAAKAIRNQAPYVTGARENIALADKFEVLLDLMIIGEGPRDRAPGVPRIV